MSIEQDHIPEEPKSSFNLMDLLARFNSITNQQIAAFRTKISTDKQDAFDEQNQKTQTILTLIDSLSLKELEALKTQNRRLPGFHEAQKHIHSLLLLTGDKKYLKKI